MYIIIGAVLCCGFFVESVIGFGGTLLAFCILGFFFDIKDLILMAIYVGTTASIFVLFSNRKAFNKKIFIQAFPLCLLGNILGATIFGHVTSQFLTTIFGFLLLFLAVKVIFFDHIQLSWHLSNSILVIGGLSQGVFGIGGPFFMMALWDKFDNKTQARATLAMFFIVFNLLRVLQFFINKTLNFELFFKLWWIPCPLAIAIHLGYLVHKKMNDKYLKKITAALSAIAGVEFLLKK